ncbi:MAG: tRNA pseudouridine(38-40) synthase TruA [Chitinophagaceae bacterium]
MPRYFLELAYKGTAYSGFQSQENANTVQAEVEKAFLVLHRSPVGLTGSSRTDAGVHARQNFFHFDYEGELHPQLIYKLNAILPRDIVLREVRLVPDEAHSRFDAVSREYEYHVYRRKDPFLDDRGYYFPYKIDAGAMHAAAGRLMEYTDFTSFSKRNTQVKSFHCRIMESRWEIAGNELIYYVKADRFLRGMVRALTATMLKVGRGLVTVEQFAGIIEAKDCTKASFAVPPHGLFLMKVNY